MIRSVGHVHHPIVSVLELVHLFRVFRFESFVHLMTKLNLRLCSPLRLELMVKLRTLLTVFTFNLKAEACDYGKRRYISNAALVFSQS